jgi:hypothetical protein
VVLRNSTNTGIFAADSLHMQPASTIDLRWLCLPRHRSVNEIHPVADPRDRLASREWVLDCMQMGVNKLSWDSLILKV